MFDRRLLKNFDYLLFFTMIALCLYGLLVISTATQGHEVGDPFSFVRRQAMWMGAGLVVLLAIISIDYINFYRWAWYLYSLTLFSLVAVLFVGREGGGAARWIDLGVFDFQPSELAKFVVIVILARLLVDYKDKLIQISYLLPLLLLLAPPMVLIFLQPDLGTALVFIIIFFGMLYMGGVPLKHLILLVGAGIALSPLAWNEMMEYQRMRLLVFFNPEIDPLGHGYQLTQSIIAIGSGGIGGKGLYEGTQANLQFLPEQHTDFIFSVLGEELGFLGGAVLLSLYLILIYRVLKIGSLSKDNFGALICCGVAALLTFQVLVNIGMTLSMMPVTGLPLPFMSYGGNNMIMNIICIALVLNVGMRRYKIQF